MGNPESTDCPREAGIIARRYLCSPHESAPMETFAASSSAILEELVVFLSGKINSNNAPVVEETLLAQRTEHPQGKFTLDVRDLEYISSAGLRVIMRLRKEEDSLNIVNASSEVYEVFDMTGISTILPVKKVLREMSIDGLELIGAGATAKVYRLDADTIIKVFNPGIGMSMIENENTRATKAFVSGVPTAISFDTVRVGDCYGTVFELLDAKDLLEIMTADKEHVLDWVRLFANSVRKMHEIEMDTAKFANVKQTSLDKLHALEGLICTPEEVAKLRKIYENVPGRTTFIHGDCHVGNVMIQDGEPVYIDLSGSGYGHPIFDMVSMCIICLMGGKNEESRARTVYTRNFSSAECYQIWQTYLRTYLDTDDEALIQKAQSQILTLSAARFLFAAISVPGLLGPKQIEGLKGIALGSVDAGLEPICF